MSVNKQIRYTKKDLINQVQDLCYRLGHAPTMMDFYADPYCASVVTIRKRFGSWNNFLKEANITPKKNVKCDKKSLILEVQDLYERLGYTPTAREFSLDEHCSSASVITKYFGFWNKFLEEAGIELNEPHRHTYTNKSLIAQVQDLYKRLGRVPTCLEFNLDPCTASATTAANYFGSWRNFILAAGLQPNKSGKPKKSK